MAQEFEGGVARARFLSETGLKVDEIVEQVTLEVNGLKIRIDYLGKDANGKFYLGMPNFQLKIKNGTRIG